MEEGHAAKKMRFTGEVVTVEVGSESSVTFKVHETILKSDSDFFKLALDKKWKEGQELVVMLPEDDPVMFDVCVGWLYDASCSPQTFRELARLYVLREKFQSSEFCNSLISKMFSRYPNGCPNINTVNTIFNGTPPNSPARIFMVDLWKAFGQAALLIDGHYNEEPHPEFSKELAMAALVPKPRTCEAKQK